METTSPAAVLPYRTDADELARWLEARARGRGPAQIRSLDFGAKVYDGTLAGAQALGFVEPGGTDLTESGRAYALASPDARGGLLRAAMSAYEPYGLLLEAVFARGSVDATETAWIETWWAAHGYGASATNRAEGAVAFARLADFAELGSYVQGRRGHPSRIEWKASSPPAATWGDLWSTTTPGTAPPAAPPLPPAAAVPAPPRLASAPAERAGQGTPSPSEPTAAQPTTDTHNSAVIDFGGGRVATLRVPAVVTEAERARLMELLALLLGGREP